MREIVIRKPATVGLLILSTIAILTVTLAMSGRSYANFDPIPFDDIRYLADRLATRPIPTNLLAVIVMPMIANVLLFVPWGFFMFVALYTVDRPTGQTWVLTVLLGLSFSLGIEAWQYFLPSRVADVNDVIWNSCGATLGAALGHLRLRVRFDFQ